MDLQVRQVFFDATDTLLRVRGSVGEIYAQLAHKHGVEHSSAEIDQSFQEQIREVPQGSSPGLPAEKIAALERGWWREVARRTFAALGPFPGFESFFDEVFELFRSPSVWELMPGARETLSALQRQGRRLGIISDMDSRLFEVLAAFAIEDAIDNVFLSFRSGFSKPDPRFFQHALRQIDCRPEVALHVGDSVRKDIEGALNAGMHAALLDETGRLKLPHGAHRIRSLSELPELLRQIDG